MGGMTEAIAAIPALPAPPPRILRSSRGRNWRGLDALLLAMPGGVVEAEPFDRHLLSLHVGAPLQVACRLDGGPERRRLQGHGDIDLLPAGSSGRWVDEGPGTAFLLRLHDERLRETAGEIGLDPGRVRLAPRQQLRDARLSHIGWALHAELEDDGPGDALYADSLATALAVQLLRLAAPAATGRALQQRGGLTPQQRRRVLEHIAATLDGDLSLAALSAVAGLGATQFKLRFRQSFGLPVHQYVILRRVEHAKTLLLQGRLPASEIALAAGFAHQSHMARSLRRLLGVTPRMLHG